MPQWVSFAGSRRVPVRARSTAKRLGFPSRSRLGLLVRPRVHSKFGLSPCRVAQPLPGELSMPTIPLVHKLSERMRRLAIVIGAAVSIVWILLVLFAPGHLDLADWIVLLIGIPMCFGFSFLLIWAVDRAGFLQLR